MLLSAFHETTAIVLCNMLLIALASVDQCFGFVAALAFGAFQNYLSVIV